jgi:hypothetical protein
VMGTHHVFPTLKILGFLLYGKWCHQLTISSRSRAAKQIHTHLKTLANSVRVDVNGINGDVTIADCESLHKKWESTPQGGEGMYGMIVIVTMKACLIGVVRLTFECLSHPKFS